MIMKFWLETSSPLVSSIVALYALILLYVPHHFLRFVFSPVLIITGILLFSLLRLGAIQKCQHKTDKTEEETTTQVKREAVEKVSKKKSKEISTDSNEEKGGGEEEEEEEEDHNHDWVDCESETDSEPGMGVGPNPSFEDSFVGWNLRAPLEVIYEEEEEEEEESRKQVVGIQRHASSLTRYYPESDESENSDDEFPATGFWNSPESQGFRWEEEDREGLIEIALDYENNKHVNNKRGFDFHVEEDNLIEIDLFSQARNDGPPTSQILLT